MFASPAIGLLVKPPANQEFSELYLLGSNHTFDNIPFNIKADVTYSVYLGIVNHQGSACYYTSLVKIGNENCFLPNATLGIPSSMPPLYEYKSFLDDGETWEKPLTFRVNKLTFSNGQSQLHSINVNGVELSVNQASTWNSNKSGYYYNLFVELWNFNSTLGISQYHNRYVSLNLNMTQ